MKLIWEKQLPTKMIKYKVNGKEKFVVEFGLTNTVVYKTKFDD